MASQGPKDYETHRYSVIENCPQFVYKALLFIIQSILRYILIVWAFIEEFRKFYVSQTNPWRAGISYQMLQRDSGTLTKIPKHLSILVTEDGEPSLNDLSSLVVWTIAFGIPYVSLYERQGILKASEDRLRKLIVSKFKEFFGEQCANYNLILKDSSSAYENGIVHPKQICVELLSEDDGKRDIVNAAHHISENVMDSVQDIKDIDITLVESHLKATKGLPDPDLALHFGPLHCLEGFLPWQIRLTEFITFTTHKGISYSSLFGAFRKFSRCEQRFGK